MVTEDVFTDVYAKDLADVFAKDFADDSTEGLEAELEEQPRAQLSFLPLPNPRRSAEQATQGRGISQVTLSTNKTNCSTSANADSSPCKDEYLACWKAKLDRDPVLAKDQDPVFARIMIKTSLCQEQRLTRASRAQEARRSQNLK